ncbi:MAG: acetylglutamate kinase [Myxococcales bacterium]|nr:acetylglutamate kinase [Myxococcales bacterium]
MLIDSGARARVLIEALPYIKEFRGSTVVVKIGGASLEDLSLRECFAQDLILLSWVGIRMVVVHGGGKQISDMLDRVGLEPQFIDGQRVTDEAVLEVVEMVLGGTLNKEIVRLIQHCGGKAVGITGKDGGMVTARRRGGVPDLGLVGDVFHVDAAVVEHLLGEYIPVVAPLAVSPEGETLNINADPFAAALAVALGARKFVVLSDIEGVLDADGELITSLSSERARELIEDGTIAGGMIPKVQNALSALDGGVGKVHIIDGRVEHALLLEVFTNGGVGTQLQKERG